MRDSKPKIAIPVPSTIDPAFSERTWPAYARAVEQSGGIPVSIPLTGSQEELANLANGCSGVLLPGSSADIDPEKYGESRTKECGAKDGPREAADEILLQDAFNLQKPILAVCYGVQSLNVWKGGSLVQHLPGPPPDHLKLDQDWQPDDSVVNHSPSDKLAHAHHIVMTSGSQMLEAIRQANDLQEGEASPILSVNSSHHQALARVGDQLVVVARCLEDGVIEAVEGADPRQTVWGVQWHPERTYHLSAASRLLFDGFIRAAKAWRPPSIRQSVSS